MPLKTIAEFTLSRLQVLDERGEVDVELEPSLTGERLLHLYRSMLLARALDEKALKLQRQGRLGTFAPNTGQEAISCGVALATTPRDWFVPSFRELGGMLMRGWPPSHFLLYHNGFEEGNLFPEGNRTLPIAVPVASQLLHAVGLAYAMAYRGEKESAVAAFVGEGGTSQGDFHEALNFAGVWKVPVVFVIQNNQWAISVPFHKQSSSKTLAQRALAYDMPGIQVDGNDVLAVYRAAAEALERARSGGGPSLIEAVTYRLLMHTTSDDPSRYRSAEEEKEWWKKEPLIRFRAYLEKKGILDAKLQAQVDDEARDAVEAAVREFEEKTRPKPDAPFDYLFGTPQGFLEEERKEILEAIAKGA